MTRPDNSGPRSIPTPPPLPPLKAQEKFDIESDIPVPEIKRSGGRESRWPFKQLEIGQSFWVHPHSDGDRKTPEAMLVKMKARASNTAKELGRKFFCDLAKQNPEDENSPMGVRIWRVEKQIKDEKGEA